MNTIEQFDSAGATQFTGIVPSLLEITAKVGGAGITFIFIINAVIKGSF